MIKHSRVYIVLLWLSFSAAQNSDEFTHIECEIALRSVPSRQEESHKSWPEFFHYSHPYIPQRRGTSNNWAGYVAFAPKGATQTGAVSAVHGSWVVPNIIKPTSSGSTYCSCWVGIDGYGSPSVEQIGTAHEWHNNKQSHYAWFEMYPAAAYEIVGFPVNPGDVIEADVVYQGNNVFVLTIKNVTRKVTTSIPTQYTTVPGTQRASAEWIAEAPYLNGVLPLANFKKVSFSRCTATINGVLGSINNRLRGYDVMNMQNNLMVNKATASALAAGGEQFDVTWNHE